MGMQNSFQSRRVDLDCLRVFAVLWLFPYHTARIFDISKSYYIQDDHLSAALTYILIDGIGPWHMPLFFLLSGSATYFALNFRSSQQYIKERFKRLLIPCIFGIVVLIPIQGYFSRMYYSDILISYFDYLPLFFHINMNDLSNYRTGNFTPGHLWFILYLFVLSLIALPLFSYLKGDKRQQFIDSMTNFLYRRWMIFLLAIPPVIALFFSPSPGGKNPAYYLIFLIYGYILLHDKRYNSIVDKNKFVALILMFILFGANLAISFLEIIPPSSLANELMHGLSYSFGTMFCLVVFLGYGRIFLNITNRCLRYASSASYPFYILHQPIIVIVGFHVVKWDVGLPIKFFAINIFSFAATLIVYDLIVKRNNVARFLFGMKPQLKKKSKTAQSFISEDQTG